MNLINGDWRAGQGDEFHSLNPATEAPVWTGNAASDQDVADAVVGARHALYDWRRRPLMERSRVVEEFGRLLKARAEEFSRLISAEVGKTLWDARTEVQAMLGKIPVSIKAQQERREERDFELPGGRGELRYRPQGVLAVFGPFNFPGHIAHGQIVPALLAGNVVILKPSELTPRVGEEIARIWEQAGAPAGVVSLVQGGGTTGQALVGAEINGVLFTGSLKTGVALRRQLVERPDKLLVLELGGNNPLVVHRIGGRVDAAVQAVIQSAYVTAGQRCTCARRLIVTPGNEDFLHQLERVVQGLHVDQPDADPQPFFGPLIHARAVENLLTEQSALLRAGATPVVQAERLPLGRAFVSPGLLDVTNVPDRRDEEVFGPLLQLIRAPDFDAALREAAATRYGLVAALFSDERRDFEQFMDRVPAGLLNWNRPTTGASGQLPFGGIGLSGNHRPAAYFTTDFCSYPLSSLTGEGLTLSDAPPPGLPGVSRD